MGDNKFFVKYAGYSDQYGVVDRVKNEYIHFFDRRVTAIKVAEMLNKLENKSEDSNETIKQIQQLDT